MRNATVQLRAPSDPQDIRKGHQKTSDQNWEQNVNQSKALFSFYEEPPVTAKFQEQPWKCSVGPTAPGAWCDPGSGTTGHVLGDILL